MAKHKHAQKAINSKSYDVEFITALSPDECAYRLRKLQYKWGPRWTSTDVKKQGDAYHFQITRTYGEQTIAKGKLNRWAITQTRVTADVQKPPSNRLPVGVILLGIFVLFVFTQYEDLGIVLFFCLLLALCFIGARTRIDMNQNPYARRMKRKLEHVLKA